MSESAPVKPLRFLPKPQSRLNETYRISGFFEHKPKWDHIVIAMIRNGYQYTDDFPHARIADVFAGIDMTFKRKRKFIERLKRHADLTVGY